MRRRMNISGWHLVSLGFLLGGWYTATTLWQAGESGLILLAFTMALGGLAACRFLAVTHSD